MTDNNPGTSVPEDDERAGLSTDRAEGTEQPGGEDAGQPTTGDGQAESRHYPTQRISAADVAGSTASTTGYQGSPAPGGPPSPGYPSASGYPSAHGGRSYQQPTSAQHSASSQQYNPQQYAASQQYGLSQQYGASQQYGGTQQHPASPQYGTSQPGASQYGTSQQYGAPQSGTGNQSAHGVYVAPPAYQSAQGYPQQPTSAPVPPLRSPRRSGRGPGWTGVIVTGVLAAALASGATFGIDRAVDGDTPASAQASKPITGSSSVDGAPNWTAVAATASKSVVAIQVGQNGQLAEQGSGFVYDDSGHILTNNHVVALGAQDGGEVSVVFNNGDTYPATIVGRDPETDIAVIKIANPPKGLDPLPAGASSDLRVGDPVMALGNPLGLADTVTTGIVSALNRPVTTVNESEDGSDDSASEVVTNAVQTDAAVNPGNSGGPLINAKGEVIGITSSIAGIPTAGGDSGGQSGSIGIGFAIPMESAKIIADQLVKSGKAQHPLLGITLNDSTVKLDGAQRGSASVVSVTPGTAADKAGLRKGDNIIAIDGTAVNSGESLQALVRSKAVGSTVKMSVVRNGKQEDVNVTLQAATS